MKRQIVCTILILLILATLGLACGTTPTTAPTLAPASTTPSVTQAVTTPAPGANTESVTLKKVDGTSVTRTTERGVSGGTFTYAISSDIGNVCDDALGFFVSSTTLYQTNSSLITGDWARGPLGTNETNWWMGVLFHASWEGPELASSWELPDNSTIVFHLRKGVRWALNSASEASRLVNGRELTADDVAWSLQRNWTSPRSWVCSTTLPKDYLISAKAIDKYTVECKVPPHIQGMHLFYTGDEIFILPREVVEKYGNMLDWRVSVGSGAFMLVDYVPGSQITYARNASYFETNPVRPDEKLPYADKLRTLIIPDSSTQQAAFRTGKIDLLPNVAWEDSQTLIRNNSRLKSLRKTATAANALAGRIDKADLPFKDVRVRLALNMAFNRKAMVDGYYKGNAEWFSYPYINDAAHATLFTPYEQLPTESQRVYQYSPEQAKQLLADAGYPNGFKTSIICTNLGDAVDVLSVVKQDFLKIGVELEIKPQENTVYTSISRGRTYDQMILGSSMENFTTVKLHSFRPESADDRSFFDSPVTRAAYDEINKWVGIDDSKCDKLLKDLTPYILANPYGVWLPMPYIYDMWWPWVKDYEGQWNIGDWNPAAFTRYIWVDQSLRKSMGY